MSTATEIVESTDLEKLVNATRSFTIAQERLKAEENELVIARKNLEKRETEFAIAKDSLQKLETAIRQHAKRL